MAVDLTNTDIYLVFFCDIFCTIQTFDWKALSLPLKDQLAIYHSVDDLFLVDLIVNIKLRPNKPNMAISLSSPISLNSSKESTPSPDIRTYESLLQ